MTIDPKILAELKKSLLEEKGRLEKDLEKIARPIDKRDGEYEANFERIGEDKDDNATEVEQYADNLPVETALENNLKNVILALSKMEDGTYGICENCQQEIGIDRLKIYPSAKTCTKCN
jgi:RNA polymerase-binding transcription factor DksA